MYGEQGYIYSDTEDLAALQRDEAEYHEYRTAKAEYEERTIAVMCEVCPTIGRSTQMALENSGWTFADGSEFCPIHRH